MGASNIDAVLSELGWNDGFRIPVASQENKLLEDQIQKKMELRERLQAKLESSDDRLQTMKKHISNLNMQQEINQKLLTAHSAQVETEDHRYRLNCNFESRLRQEARNYEKEFNDVNELVGSIERDLQKMTRKIDSSKKAIKFDETSLQSLEDALNKNTEDNQLIEKYMKEDAKSYKELELERLKLSADLATYRKAIVRATVESRELEVVLDRTGKLYKEALKEGQNIVNQWKESVGVLQQRDSDIEQVLREIETLNELLTERKRTVQECGKFHQEQIDGNNSLKASIKNLEKKLATMKEEQLKTKETILMYETELRVQKNIVKELAQRSQQTRANIKQKQAQIESKCLKIEESKEQINYLTDKLQSIDKQAMNIEERTKELERMMEEQEQRKVITMREISKLQSSNLRVVNQTKDLESQSRILEGQYQTEYKQSEFLDTLVAKKEKLLGEKKEALYQVEFELQKAEMKLERLRGQERDKSEAEAKQQKMEELQNVLNDRNQMSKLLQKQITNLEYDIKKFSNALSNDNSEVERLRNKRQDLVLLMEGGEKRVKAAQARNEEKLVEQSLLRLKVSQMEKMIAALGDNVYSLEKYRLELDAAIRERKAEIGVQEESLIVQRRVAASECSELRNAIAERKTRIHQLQSRYENGIAMMGKNPDGTPKNTTYLKIQNAQEKFLLQEQGDKLDEAIRRTELEIQSMENTLRVINACNDKYKVTIKSGEEEEAEEDQQKKLEDELRDIDRRMKLKHQELEYEKQNMMKLEQHYTQLVEDIERTKSERDEKERFLSELMQQISDQKGKMLRAEKDLRLAQKDIRNLYTCTEDKIILVQEKEVELRDIREQNIVALQDIAEFAIRHVEVEAYMKRLLLMKNIELPSMSLSRQSKIWSQSTIGSADYPPRSTGRASAGTTSKESIGSVVNIEVPMTSKSNDSITQKSTKSEKMAKDRKPKRVSIAQQDKKK